MNEWAVAREGCLEMSVVLVVTDLRFLAFAEYAVYENFRAKGCDLLNTRNMQGRIEVNKLNEIRKELGLTQTEFAEFIGKSLRQVQYYESGKIDVPKHVHKFLELCQPGRGKVRQTLWQEKRRKRGLCILCGKKAEAKADGTAKSRCTTCLNRKGRKSKRG